jgi:hypothetical protein
MKYFLMFIFLIVMSAQSIGQTAKTEYVGINLIHDNKPVKTRDSVYFFPTQFKAELTPEGKYTINEWKVSLGRSSYTGSGNIINLVGLMAVASEADKFFLVEILKMSSEDKSIAVKPKNPLFKIYIKTRRN